MKIILWLLHAIRIRDRIRRLICRLWCHDWVHDVRGEPVVAIFIVCRRCGKWRRLGDVAEAL